MWWSVAFISYLVPFRPVPPRLTPPHPVPPRPVPPRPASPRPALPRLAPQWTLPVVLLMYVDFQMGELLDTMDRLNEERLTDSEHLAITRPEALRSVRDAMVAKRMLSTMVYVLTRMDKVFNSKGIVKDIQKELKRLQDEEEIAANYFDGNSGGDIELKVTAVVGGGGGGGAAANQPPPAPWVEVETPQGTVFYHNTVTDETSWAKPKSPNANANPSGITAMVGEVSNPLVARADDLGAEIATSSEISEWSHYDEEHRESMAKVNSLSAIRQNIRKHLQTLAKIQVRMDRRLATLEREDRAADAADLRELLAGKRGRSCFGRWRARREFNAMMKAERKELEDDVALAGLPRRMHLAAEQQQKIIDGFTGRLGSMPMGMFSGPVRALKRYLYSSYCSVEVDTSRNSISRGRLVIQKRVSYAIGIIYLMACTFYIFLYAVRVQDNEVVNSVLMSVAFSDGLEVLVTGPLVMLVTAGVFPMLAVSLIGNDIRKILTVSKRKLDAGRHDDEVTPAPRRLPRELAPPCSRRTAVGTTPIHPKPPPTKPPINLTHRHHHRPPPPPPPPPPPSGVHRLLTRRRYGQPHVRCRWPDPDGRGGRRERLAWLGWGALEGRRPGREGARGEAFGTGQRPVWWRGARGRGRRPGHAHHRDEPHLG